ncbi:MAG: hypothetical protein ABR540_04185 [Acidimicrobiales bacterium]|nr:hypothetical protein [Actinomycetota bacterium]
MAKTKYRITFVAGTSGQTARSQEVDADQVGHIHDGTISWLNFHDDRGEVLRVRSASVERVDRMG